MIIKYIIGGLIIILGLLVFVAGVYTVCQGEISGIIMILLGIVFIPAGVAVIKAKDNPTKQDVLDGKAVYQEAQIITGSDTIKIYEIVWKQNNH